MEQDYRDLPFPIEVTEALSLPNHRLLVAFADGKRGVFSMAHLLGKGVFSRLYDEGEFRRVRVADGAPVWPGGIDIAPERLWTDCEPIADADWGSYVETARVYANPDLYRKVQGGDADVAAGRFVSHDLISA